ncbi:uncharacterized protein ACIBXB_005964 isoform 2-T2 [Morphnus guianensis]
MRPLGARPAAFIYPLRTFQKGPPPLSAPANPLAYSATLPTNGRQPEPAPFVTRTGRGRARRPAGILEPSCAFPSPPPQPPTAPQRSPPARNGRGGGASLAREPMRALQRPHAGDDTGVCASKSLSEHDKISVKKMADDGRPLRKTPPGKEG